MTQLANMVCCLVLLALLMTLRVFGGFWTLTGKPRVGIQDGGDLTLGWILPPLWAFLSVATFLPTRVLCRCQGGPAYLFCISVLVRWWIRLRSWNVSSLFQNPLNNTYAPINVKPAGEESGHGVGIRHFSKICSQIPCPQANHSSQMQPNFPTPGLHIAVKYPKAGPEKGTIKISPNKTLQSLFILRCCITKDTYSCYSFNYSL